jgi:cell division topological specificity factor
MNVFRSLQLGASAPVARERLQILLEYERKLGSQIDLFAVLREEILAVVNRLIADPENVQVTVDRGAKLSTLGVNVEIPNPGGNARTLPTNCAVLQPDKTVGTRGLRVKRQMMQGVDAVAGTLALPIWLVGGTVGAMVAVVLGGWLYVQQRDVGKRRALDDRETALIAGFEEYVIAPRPAGAVVAETGPLVALRGTSAPGMVVSLPGDPATAEPASPSAAVTPAVTTPIFIRGARRRARLVLCTSSILWRPLCWDQVQNQATLDNVVKRVIVPLAPRVKTSYAHRVVTTR